MLYKVIWDYLVRSINEDFGLVERATEKQMATSTTKGPRFEGSGLSRTAC